MDKVALVDQDLYTYCVRAGSVINAAVATSMDLFGCARLFDDLLQRLPPHTLTQWPGIDVPVRDLLPGCGGSLALRQQAVDGARVEELVRRDIGRPISSCWSDPGHFGRRCWR